MNLLERGTVSSFGCKPREGEVLTTEEGRSVGAYYVDQITAYLNALSFEAESDEAVICGNIRKELYHLEQVGFTGASLVVLGLRALKFVPGELSTQTQQATENLFRYVRGSQEWFALQQPVPDHLKVDGLEHLPQAWQHSLMSIMAVEKKAPGLPPEKHRSHVLPEEVWKLIKESGLSTKYTPIILQNQGKFGLTLCVAGILQQYAFISMPTQDLHAHGLDMNPFWAAAHDVFHWQLLNHTKGMRDAAAILVLDIQQAPVGLRLDFDTYTKVVCDLIQTRYEGMMFRFQAAFEKATQQFLEGFADNKKTARQTYNRMLAVLFEVFHEKRGIQASDLTNAKDSENHRFRTIVSNFLGATFDDTLETFDPLCTDPITGASSLDKDAQIGVLREQDISMPDFYYLPLSHKPALKIAEAKSFYADKQPVVDPGPILYGIQQKLKDGTILEGWVTSLRGSFGDATDHNALLKIAGYSVAVPKLSDIADSTECRRVAFDFISAVNTAQKNMVTDFFNWFEQYVAPTIPTDQTRWMKGGVERVRAQKERLLSLYDLLDKGQYSDADFYIPSPESNILEVLRTRSCIPPAPSEEPK